MLRIENRFWKQMNLHNNHLIIHVFIYIPTCSLFMWLFLRVLQRGTSALLSICVQSHGCEQQMWYWRGGDARIVFKHRNVRRFVLQNHWADVIHICPSGRSHMTGDVSIPLNKIKVSLHFTTLVWPTRGKQTAKKRVWRVSKPSGWIIHDPSGSERN